MKLFKTKKDFTKHLRIKRKSRVLIAAFISSIVVTVGLCVIGFTYFFTLSPFKAVYAKTNNSGQAIRVAFKTTVPTKTRVEYGTSRLYLNTTEIADIWAEEHEWFIPNTLPNRTHYVRFVAYTEQGKEYTSGFYVVE